jgi:hypothetical protein
MRTVAHGGEAPKAHRPGRPPIQAIAIASMARRDCPMNIEKSLPSFPGAEEIVHSGNPGAQNLDVDVSVPVESACAMEALAFLLPKGRPTAVAAKVNVNENHIELRRK